MRILIVDDSAAMRHLIERTLRLASLPITEIHHATNGRQALAHLRAHAFDLILTDLNMPIMSGLEFLERRQAESLAPNVPTAVLAAESGRSLIRRSLQLGAHAYLPKPFHPTQLRQTLLPLLPQAA
jgi:two-component system chemotaxis response regulator CheY